MMWFVVLHSEKPRAKINLKILKKTGEQTFRKEKTQVRTRRLKKKSALYVFFLNEPRKKTSFTFHEILVI